MPAISVFLSISNGAQRASRLVVNLGDDARGIAARA
jgi:hypothetical protein